MGLASGIERRELIMIGSLSAVSLRRLLNTIVARNGMRDELFIAMALTP